MSLLGYIIVFSFIGSVVSLLGGVLLLFREKFAKRTSHLMASYAAGTLLATAFWDLIPEANESAEVLGIGKGVYLWILIGILAFFFLERFIKWFHHHHEHEAVDRKQTVALIMTGDTIHNFIDGVAVAATFMTSVPLGIVTSLAVAAHEIPQEIGDFGLMLHRGLNRKKILLFNMFSALAAMLGAVLTYFAGDLINGLLPFFLALTAGFFIYIAASDLIPEIHEESKYRLAILESSLLVLGVMTIVILVSILEG